MMKLTALILFVWSAAAAGPFSHPLRVGAAVTAAAPDTLRILAVMAQFQTDITALTSGDGRFDLGPAAAPIIDAPPHDSAYFADHLLFAQNYFRKVSGGRLHVDGTVLGPVITLPAAMQHYAPVSGNAPLVAMIEETWHKADSLHPGFPFGSYDMFIIFHAGVGKDIDLRGTLGYDPTPYDIPSLYFNINGFRSVKGTSYPGVPVSGGAFITNSALLPETEVRAIPTVGEDFILKLGINGLMAGMIGSHLGLPDLFDTRTGRTAIGRFGLMDGQAMFSFSGICPPEPSAWEKQYLGWVTPVTVSSAATLPLPAVGLTETDTVYRVPVSAKEYFLVENRQRDAKQDHQTVTMRWKGNVITRTFTRDEEFFSNTNIDSVYGTVIDVDEPDWSLPGLINSANDYRGGVLIWHIDETVIERTLASNSVNADPAHRGVDVEEADGSQDIGMSYDLLSAGSGSEDGSPIDYWFAGNISPVFADEFSNVSQPNSLSNSRARTSVLLQDFSASSPRMTVRYQPTGAVRLSATLKRTNRTSGDHDAPTLADLDGDGADELVYTSGDSIYAVRQDLTPFFANGTGLFSRFGGRFQPAVFRIPGSPVQYIVGIRAKSVVIFANTDADADGNADTLFAAAFGSDVTSPAATYTSVSTAFVITGTASGRRVQIARTGPAQWNIDSTQLFAAPVIGVIAGPSPRWYSADSIDAFGIVGTSGGHPFTAAGAAQRSGLIGITNAPAVYINGGNAPAGGTQHALPAGPVSGFALADVNGDRTADVLTASGPRLYAVNHRGIILDRFPLTAPDGGNITGSAAVTALRSTGETVILFGTQSGQLCAVTASGKMVDGFPLQTGGVASTPLLWGTKLVTASNDTSVYVWESGALFDTSRSVWNNPFGDRFHSSFAAESGTPAPRSEELLPPSLVYNWPNPVYRGTTNIRYFLGKEASVTVTIMNMAGELVQKLRGTGYAGIDNEVAWDVTNVQSGVYYAQVTASGPSGEQSRIIKIAVIK